MTGASQQPNPDRPLVYQIRVRGHLGHQWTGWFEGFTVTLQKNGETVLTGPVVDQAALHGLLKKIRDDGLPLVSVTSDNQRRRREMNRDRVWAVVIGLLFLIAMGTSMVGDGMIQSRLSGPDDLARLTGNRIPVITGSLLWLVDGFAVVAIAVFLYPYLRKDHEPLALGYVGFRIVEFAIIVIYLIVPLILITLSQRYGTAGTEWGAVVAMLFGLQYWCLQLIYLFNGVAGGLLSVLLYRSRLVPRWISVVGIAGYGILIPAAVLDMMALVDLALFPGLLVFVPGSAFEILFFPIWLFARGLTLSAGTNRRQEVTA
jgi:hypothetical protein